MALTADDLKKIGFNDPNVINGILNDPNQVARYEKELGLSSGGTSGSGNNVDNILNSYINSLSGLFPKSVAPYEEKNPFLFDEALAKNAATKEYSPYYDEMLTDYTTSVERQKSRSHEDLKSTLDQLAAGKEYYMGTERRLLDRTLDQTNKGYAGRGLFFSGAKEKEIQQIQQEYGAQTGEYQRRYQYGVGQAELGAKRTAEDINTAQSMYGRDIGRAKQTAIAQGVLQRQSEAVQQYEMGRTKYYDAARYGGIS